MSEGGRMPETIIKNGFRISISMETGEVIISTEDYHAGELVINKELAEKMLAAVKRKTAFMAAIAEKPKTRSKAAKRKLRRKARRAKRKRMQAAKQDGTIAD
jgi:hypothetical protein